MKGLRIAPGLTLPLEAVTQTFGIIAKRGVGKTYTALVMAEEIFKAGLPEVIIDPMGVCWGLRASADGKGPGLPILVLGGEHGDVPLEPTAGEVIAEFVVNTRQSVVLDLSLFRKGEQVRFATDFSEYIYHHNRHPLHIILDEADMFAPQKPYKGQERMLGAVEDLVRRGRARGIGLTMCTQRAAVLNKDVLTQVEVLVTLRTLSPQDQAAALAWVKAKGLGKAEEYMASLADLPIGTAWFWSPGWLNLFKKVNVRTRDTFDSSATPKVGVETIQPKRLAPVDISKLAADIAGSIERAKANDPRELRKKIVELEAYIKKVVAAPVPVEVIEYKDRPVLTDEDRAFLSEAVDDLRTSIEAIRQQRRIEMDALEAKVSGVDSAIERLIKAMPVGDLRLSDVSRMGGTVRLVPRGVEAEADRAGKAFVKEFDRVLNGMQPDTRDRDLRAGERKMLLAAYRRYPMTMTRAQLGTLSGFAPKGGTFGTYLGVLKRRGYLEESMGRVSITDTGLKQYGGAPAQAMTTEEIRETWRRALRRGEREMLDWLIAVYPHGSNRAQLGEATGFAVSGGTFGTYLGALKRNGLVEERDGLLTASATLFGG